MKETIARACLLLTLAHMNYPPACCGGSDCRPVPCDEIHLVGENWVYQDAHWPKDKVQDSLDGACHVCITKGGIATCLFMGGVS